MYNETLSIVYSPVMYHKYKLLAFLVLFPSILMGCEQSFPNVNADIDICGYTLYSDRGSLKFCIVPDDREEIQVFLDNSLNAKIPLTFYVLKKDGSRRVIKPNSEIESDLLKLLNRWLENNYTKDSIQNLEAMLNSGEIESLSEKIWLHWRLQIFLT